MLLDKLLAALEVEVAPFAVCDVRHGWSVQMPASGFVVLHFVVAGSGRLHMPDHTRWSFQPDTVLVVPPGRPHRIEPPVPAEDRVQSGDARWEQPGLSRLVAGDGSPGVLLVCGSVRATYAGAFGIFDGLEQPLVIPFTDEPGARAVFEGLVREQSQSRPGSSVMLRALMTQGIVMVLRRLCTTGDCAVPWLASLEDPQLTRALSAMLDAPERPHTLESVAKIAGMSRSSFAERFSRVFGRPPMDLLREVRLRRAAELLRRTDLPVKSVAERVGFASRSHFSRMFQSHYGLDPTAFRSSGFAPPAP